MGNGPSICQEDDPALGVPINEDEFYVRLTHESVKDTYTLRKLIDARTTYGSLNITIKLAPMYSPQRTITTKALHGSTTIDFTSSLGASAQHLTSAHESYHSSLNMTYPDDWIGTIEINLQHGSYSFSTPDSLLDEDSVRVLRDVKVSGWRTITAVKGKGITAWCGVGSVMRLKSNHGSVKVEFKRKRERGPELLLPVPVKAAGGFVREEERNRIDPVTPAELEAAMGLRKHVVRQAHETTVAEPVNSGAPPPYEESEASHAVTSDGVSPWAPRSPIRPS